MSFINSLTEVIAGPHSIRRSQERATERRYAGLEQKMRGVRDIFPEPAPSVSSVATSVSSSRAPSIDGKSRRPSARPLFRPELQRSHSELPISAKLTQPKSRFPPCITAMDLDSEQIKRNYSHNDLQSWDKSKYPMPPLAAMQGFGRYRTAVGADPEWRNEHFRKKVHEISGLDSMVANLDMQDVTGGMSNEEWQELAGSVSRRGSAVSTLSTTTTSSGGAHDSQNPGPKISRGFSSTSSLRSSLAHSRKGSNLSTMALPSDLEIIAATKPMQRQSSLVANDRRGSGPGPLTTITEFMPDPIALAQATRKVERPCDFTIGGNTDSAVASDDEDGEWCDEPESRPPQVSVITQIIKEGKRPDPQPGLTRIRTTSSDKPIRRTSAAGLERSKTVRARPQPRRSNSRTKQTLHDRHKSDDKIVRQAMMSDLAESVDEKQLVYIKKPLTIAKPKRTNASET